MRRTILAACAALLTCALMAGAAVGAAGARAARARTAAAGVSGLDQVSMMTSMEGDLFEVAGGKLALTKTHNLAVAKLARTLIKDHSKSYQDTSKLAKRLGVEVQKKPAPSMVWELLTVGQMSGTTFDRLWSSLEVYDHKQDIQETMDEIKLGSSADVIANAKQDLPVLKKHLRLAEAALKSTR